MASCVSGLGFVFITLFIIIINQFSLSFAYTNTHLLRRIAADKRLLLTNEEHWLNQTLDHFSPYDHRQFQQRYYEFLDYFRSPDGPIFLKICGEAACHGISKDYISVLAKKFGAAIVAPEHRYYGKSSPFKSHTTKNLRYLSSKQALFDLAVFRQYYQESLNRKLNRSNVENPWFVFGGSYAGALSAWFRLKFPHLTCGSLASSGVVLAVYNFTDFDRQVGVSAGPECKAILQEVTQLVEERLESNEKELKSVFNAAELKIDGDFLYLLADAGAIAFQYGNPDKLCSPLVEAKKTGQDLVDAYASYVKDYYLGTFGAKVETYNQEHLKATTAGEASSDRLWWFQVCSEVAYFQVAPANDSIRSSKIDTKYHLDLCKNVFGDGVYPEVDSTNLYYGGTKIAGSKIVFANGSQDPWRHASKQTSSPGSYRVRRLLDSEMDNPIPSKTDLYLISRPKAKVRPSPNKCLPTSFLVIIAVTVVTCQVALKRLQILKGELKIIQGVKQMVHMEDKTVMNISLMVEYFLENSFVKINPRTLFLCQIESLETVSSQVIPGNAAVQKQ